MDDTGGGTVLILGGRSEIGTELAQRLAPGATVVLAARCADRLGKQASALRAAGRGSLVAAAVRRVAAAAAVRLAQDAALIRAPDDAVGAPPACGGESR